MLFGFVFSKVLKRELNKLFCVVVLGRLHVKFSRRKLSLQASCTHQSMWT